jgi:hypothetical protein
MNFHVKVNAARYANDRPFNYWFLSEFGHYFNVDLNIGETELMALADKLETTDFSKEFQKARQKYLCDNPIGASARILDALL